jgi:NAD(P)-dependent dehydrogenase (short-subunit alcohol dehydrogenase family)
MLSANLVGKRAFVTGASSGLGRHFAKVLAASGAEVIAAARRVDPLTALCDEIASCGGRAMSVPIDVTDAASVARAVSAAGPIDILVNNAGVTVSLSAIDTSEADYDHVVDTDQKGAFLVATEVARTMRDRGGSIINVASILGLRQAGHATAYAMAKAALVQMTRQLALELARYRIRCNALAPGYFETDLNRAFFATDKGRALIRRIPAQRLGRMEDLDGALLLLASEASAFMTGSVIAVDGGHLVSSL